MRVKALLFDLDGVILDSEKVYCKFWKQASDELGYQVGKEIILQLRSCDSSIANAIIEKATGQEGSYQQIRSKRKELMKGYMDQYDLEIKPGVREFLEDIKELQLKKVIVTSAVPDEKIPILKKLGIADYFDDIISVKDVSRSKPYPDVYIYACKSLGLAPEECLAIEDAPNGIKSAFDAGLDVVMVPDLSDPTEELKKMCTVVNRIDEITNILE